jgi:hypothetical protein
MQVDFNYSKHASSSTRHYVSASALPYVTGSSAAALQQSEFRWRGGTSSVIAEGNMEAAPALVAPGILQPHRAERRVNTDSTSISIATARYGLHSTAVAKAVLYAAQQSPRLCYVQHSSHQGCFMCSTAVTKAVLCAAQQSHSINAGMLYTMLALLAVHPARQ